MLPLILLIPLIAAVAISSINRFPRKVLDVVAVVSTFCGAALSVKILIAVINNGGVIVYKVGSWMPPAGISLVADGLTAFMLVLVNVLGILLLLYSSEYA
jgi:multicomponent Na+:H+ antiporter subunit D